MVASREAMIGGMAPVLRDGCFVFCTGGDPAGFAGHAIDLFREDEGWLAILPVAEAAALGFACDTPMRQITLQVFSALDGVGLTAAVAHELGDSGIACNMVAAFHHDHVFVPAADAERALDVLERLQASVALMPVAE